MTIIYYRKSDGVMLGSSTGSNVNILKEKEDLENDQKQSVGALRLDSRPDFNGKIVTVQNDQLLIADDPVLVSKKQKRDRDLESAFLELKKLGLTDDHLIALFGRA